MKHTLTYITLFLLTLTSCEREGSSNVNLTPAGKVQVDLHLSAIYGTETESTRATLPRNLNPEPPKLLLPEGSTLWVIIAKKETNNSYTNDAPKPYKVIASAGGYLSLYPMASKADPADSNRIIPDEDEEPSSPLYLEPGTYRFRMISPAKSIDKLTHQATVFNGEYLYATDERYNQTKAEDVVITPPANDNSENNVQRIYLRPMIQQVARMKFTLIKGASVHSLEVFPEGIEITGLQNNPDGTVYNWGSENIADTLQMKRGDKRGIVKVKEIYLDEANDEFVAHVGVLPTNAESNSIVALFNVVVNGVPTQYSAMFNKMVLLHAHSYNFKFSIGIENGVAVATPLYESWTIEQTF